MAPLRIQRLPEVLINQIAAGEVIERPASVVKELLENSLDAQASAIEIDIEDGGLQLIRITDDGVGIAREDLPLACCRHATSKLSTLTELERIATLGFRGEALASIAAIAKVKLSARARDADLGWEIVPDGGDVAPLESLRPSPVTQGTVVEVRDLFFSTPARRKYLRSPRHEFLQILGLVRKVAMSRPAVSFRLTHNRRQVLRFQSAAPESRARQIFGAAMEQTAVPFNDGNEVVKLWGWLFTPGTHMARNDEQFLFVNGRMLRSRQLIHALRQAAEGLVADGENLGCVVFIETDPALFDVNVHPNKLEVRFRDVRMLHDLFYSLVRRVLAGHDPGIEPPAIADQIVTYPIAESGSGGSRFSAGRARGVVPPSPSAPLPVRSRMLRDGPVERSHIVLYQRLLLHKQGSCWQLLDLHKLLTTIMHGAGNGSPGSPLLRSIPLLLPLPLPPDLAASLQAVIQPLDTLGFGFDFRAGVLHCLRVPALLRGFSLLEFLQSLTRAGASSGSHPPDPDLIGHLVTCVLAQEQGTAKSDWLDTCLFALTEMAPSDQAAIGRTLPAAALLGWLEAGEL